MIRLFFKALELLQQIVQYFRAKTTEAEREEIKKANEAREDELRIDAGVTHTDGLRDDGFRRV
jgi:hypothetical protein